MPTQNKTESADKYYQWTLEALKEAKEGLVISHKKMGELINTLLTKKLKEKS